MDVLRDNPELRPFVLSNVRLTGITIGAGAYGSVEEVAIPGAICAAKKIHEIFLDRSQIPPYEIRNNLAQFVRECQLMSSLRHPNIVQFLGVCFFPGSRLPALVMERLLTSLHDLLDPEIDPPPPPDAPKPFFPLGLKCSILHNVGSGLAFLHEQSPPIIHRDLSARNVLLNSGMVGKIADLGVARIVPRMRAAATMTKAPGASVYMPPEALDDKPEQREEEEGKTAKYDASIDVFSFGVVSIFTLCQTFPCTLLAPNYREGRRLVGRTELERREHYMRIIYSQLREQHPLIQMIERCLDFPEDRPSIREVLCLLDQARAEERDEQTEKNKLELLQALQSQPRDYPLRSQNLEQALQPCVQEITVLQQQLQSSEREKQTIRQQMTAELTRAEETLRREQQQLITQLSRAEETIRREQHQIQEMRERENGLHQQLMRGEAELISAEETVRREQQQRQQRDELVQAKDRELCQAQQRLREKEEELRSSEALLADFQKSLQQKDSELESLRTKGSVVASTSSFSQPAHQALQSILRTVPHRIPTPSPKRLAVQCHRKKTAPCRMVGRSTTTDRQFSYFTPLASNSVYRYQWSTEKWEKLPPCPCSDSGLVIINGQLTAVGGQDGFRTTNKVFTFRQRHWIEEYPPMKAARSKSTVVSSPDGDCIIVIGGTGGGWTATVQLFQVSSRKWHQLKDLPQSLPDPSATRCGSQLHVIGSDGNGYSCSLQALLPSDRPITSQSIAHLISWISLPRLPVTGSTAATLSGQLVIIGGNDGPLVNSIHQLFNGQWVVIGSMSYGRCGCLVVSPSPDKMMIVGGKRSTLVGGQIRRHPNAIEILDFVEECVV